MPIQKQKITFFEEVISDFFRKTGRHELPWRRKGITPYEVWVSEVMLQQTQVTRVVSFYQRFLKKFPTVQLLGQASWEEFLPFYEGLGYYARGRNMLATAKIVTEKYGGIFPKTKKELLYLPGVGDYTASAILSFGYNKSYLAWDTNLKRVVGRFFFGNKKAEIPQEKLEKIFVTPRKKLNAALMDFGSLLCSARPKCANCPLQKQCEYVKTDGRHEPSKRNAVTTQATATHQIVILHEGHKKYFSSYKNIYKPFVLTQEILSRAATKKWFLDKYGLRVAVRPPHAKVLFEGNITIFTNAQILAGNHGFKSFSKVALTEYTKGIH
jgi:A/G-specific adenine glycosylase